LEYDFRLNARMRFDWKWHKWTYINNKEGKGEEVAFDSDFTIKI